MKKAVEVLNTATDLVSGSRAHQHGDISINFSNIAYLWNSFLCVANKPTSAVLTAHDVATMLELMKIARRYSGALNIDDYVDSAGYAAIAAELCGCLDQDI